MSGSGIGWAICKSAPRSRQITMPAPHHSVFYTPDALPAGQPTASKHQRPVNHTDHVTNSLATLVIQSLVTDPTTWQPGSTFLVVRGVHCTVSTQGLCAANPHKWGLASSDKCGCGMVKQRHIRQMTVQEASFMMVLQTKNKYPVLM